ncbi:hypothetical protein JXL21_04795 [Candidatus Bathyarchaeota archaeon]|nr:hypothetical protein [Candidatus Bathyarchaeota archaeon]
MQCPECQTEMRVDRKKWMSMIVGMEEKTFALYYCPNPACSMWERPVCKNADTDEPYTGPMTDDQVHLIETAYI